MIERDGERGSGISVQMVWHDDDDDDDKRLNKILVNNNNDDAAADDDNNSKSRLCGDKTKQLIL